MVQGLNLKKNLTSAKSVLATVEGPITGMWHPAGLLVKKSAGVKEERLSTSFPKSTMDLELMQALTSARNISSWLPVIHRTSMDFFRPCLAEWTRHSHLLPHQVAWGNSNFQYEIAASLQPWQSTWSHLKTPHQPNFCRLQNARRPWGSLLLPWRHTAPDIQHPSLHMRTIAHRSSPVKSLIQTQAQQNLPPQLQRGDCCTTRSVKSVTHSWTSFCTSSGNMSSQATCVPKILEDNLQGDQHGCHKPHCANSCPTMLDMTRLVVITSGLITNPSKTGQGIPGNTQDLSSTAMCKKGALFICHILFHLLAAWGPFWQLHTWLSNDGLRLTQQLAGSNLTVCTSQPVINIEFLFQVNCYLSVRIPSQVMLQTSSEEEGPVHPKSRLSLHLR